MEEKEYTFEDLLIKVQSYNNKEEDLELLKKAYKYACKVHAFDTRISGESLIQHCIRVSMIVTETYADIEAICASLLHEVLNVNEDLFDDLCMIFGDEIAKLVNGMHKINKLNFTSENEQAIQTERKILVGLSEDVRVILIKLANRLDNMRHIEEMPVNKQKAKARETLEVLTPIAHRLGINYIKSELEDLALKYSKRDAYDDVLEKLNKSKDERDKAVQDMIHEVSSLLNEHHIKHEIKGRSKSIYSTYKKLSRGRKISDIYDLLALRVFVETEAECYLVLGLIHSKFKPIPSRFKDYISMPKSNMYQSLHTGVFGVEHNIFEIQIRTHEMDRIAEYGVASHVSYKEGKSGASPNAMDQKLQLFRTIIELNEDQISTEEFMDSMRDEVLNDQIYVYTPKGDVIDLPNGATPLDFAYRVHTEVGDHTIGAMVNNNIVPLSYHLESGDIVSIKTSNNSKGPKLEWLNFVKTNQAKDKIRGFYNKIDKDFAIKKGEDLLLKELRKKKVDFDTFYANEVLLLEQFKAKDLKEIYFQIGSSKITALMVVNIITEKNKSKEEQILNKVMNATMKEVSLKKDIAVEGIDEIKVNLAKCCLPVKGDEIIGYITKGNGITVHCKNCPSLKDTDRLIGVSWNETAKKKYPAKIAVETRKVDNILMELINKASNGNLTIDSVNTVQKLDSILFYITIAVYEKKDLEKYLNDLSQVANVLRAERVIG